MELSTPIGIVLALIGVGVGMVIKGASLTALINPAPRLRGALFYFSKETGRETEFVFNLSIDFRGFPC